MKTYWTLFRLMLAIAFGLVFFVPVCIVRDALNVVANAGVWAVNKIAGPEVEDFK